MTEWLTLFGEGAIVTLKIMAMIYAALWIVSQVGHAIWRFLLHRPNAPLWYMAACFVVPILFGMVYATEKMGGGA